MRMQRPMWSNRARLPEVAVGFALAFGLPMASSVAWAYDTQGATQPLSKASRLATCDKDGKTLFALSLVSGTIAESKAAPRVAVIVDTSASQNGAYRQESLDIAQAIIESLPEGALVSLLACDVESEVYASGVRSDSADIASALDRLKQRVPLGTTDLATAIRTASKSLGEQGDKSVVYIGDGFHLSNLLNTSEFDSLVGELVAARCSVSSLAIGPKTDCEFLATLANHTGGRVLVRSNIQGVTLQQIGGELSKIASLPVFWPKEANWPVGIATRYPERIPPIRGDRDSILIGVMSSKSLQGTLRIDGEVAGQTKTLQWDLVSEASDPDLGFLGALVSKSSSNAGVLLPTAGSDALREVGELLSSSSDVLVKDAKFALHIGDTTAAKVIAKEALERSPANLEAQTILEAAQIDGAKRTLPVLKDEAKGGAGEAPAKGFKPKIVKFVTAQVQPPAGDPFGDPAPSNAAPGAGQDPFGDAPAEPAAPITSADPLPAGKPDNPFPAQDPLMPSAGGNGAPIGSDPFGELSNAGDLLNQDAEMRRVAAQALERQVMTELSRARTSDNPSASKGDLKLLLDQIRRSLDLDPASRVQLEPRLGAGIQATAKAEADLRERIARSEAVQSAASASRRLLADRDRREATIQQLVQRFDSLIEQQLYSAANNEIAPQIHELAHNSAASESGIAQTIWNLQMGL